MRDVLGTFAKGCDSRVPLYGCSAPPTCKMGKAGIIFRHALCIKVQRGSNTSSICTFSWSKCRKALPLLQSMQGILTLRLGCLRPSEDCPR